MTRSLPPESFHGQKLRSFDIHGIRLSEWSYAPGMHFAWHAHESPFLNVVVEGAYIKTDGRRTWDLSPFTLNLHPAGERHADRFSDTGGRVFDLELAPRWLDRAREDGLRLDLPAQFSGGLPVLLARRLHREFRRRDSVSSLVIEGLTLELLGELSRRPAPIVERRPPRWLRQARELLHSRFTDTLSLHEIAAAVGVHPDHLARVFRQQYHCSVGDTIRRLRIDFACRQMTTSDLPLYEIALSAGFSDHSHFTRTFKRLMGMTPSEFQGSLRKCKADPSE